MFLTASRYRFPYQNCSKEEMFPAKTICDVCGRERKCCTYGEYENGIHSVCADCFRKGLAVTKVPESVASQIYGPDAKDKVEKLKHTPPICWNGENQWPCCCNDFMIYEGSWMDYTQRDSELEDTFRDFYRVAQEDLSHPIEDIQETYLDLPFIYTDHVFRCAKCGKHSILLQRYFDEQEIAEYEKDREGFRKKYFPERTADMYEIYGQKPCGSDHGET